MHASLRPLSFVLPFALLAGAFAHAQMDVTVRTEYAEVLRVEPVYLPAAQLDEDVKCAPMQPIDQAVPPPADDQDIECIPLTSTRQGAGVQVMYDVDYVLRGVKYRSRLPFDPGNRLQVQLSVKPLAPPSL